MLVNRKYGMSIQALLRRLRVFEIITGILSPAVVRGHQPFGGGANMEPWRPLLEQPHQNRCSVLHALAKGLISQEEAAAMTGETPKGRDDLAGRRAPILHEAAAGRVDANFLAEQAEKLSAHGAQDSEWREMEAGDLVEY